MGQTPGAVAAFPAKGAGQLKARARGALICALFGSAWISGHPTALWFLTVTLPAIALTAWAILRIRAFRHLVSSPADVAHWKAFRKFLWIDSAIEWALVGLGTFLLSRYGRYDLIPQLFGLIIGLHFLPLARIFHLPRYYWVSGILIVGEVCSLLVRRGDFRNIIGCMVDRHDLVGDRRDYSIWALGTAADFCVRQQCRKDSSCRKVIASQTNSTDADRCRTRRRIVAAGRGCSWGE